ncbi:DNA/RNA non-specific endonuclease [Kitasatospora sp. NPDC096147]|uniref:DNA/RNA non-specific endonuclease n=1 Tax=Kitasatospora sp. NPDC096147 TaxID=3364093 RepID=UPI0037F8BDE1
MTSPHPQPAPTAPAAVPAPTPAQLAGRRGYRPRFLGPEVPLPLPVDPGTGTVVLRYTHFSVVFRPDRRLAAATAVAIDGHRLRDLPREGDRWRFDPRIPAAQQAGDALYDRNGLDRGHLVRRLDPVWGGEAEALQANDDTFYFTNAAPQSEDFNRSKLLWLGLESYLLDHAADSDRRLVVLSGPVLRPDDPPYRGMRIPLSFWKVTAFLTEDGELASTAYLLNQSPDLSTAPPTVDPAGAAEAVPPLGAYRTFQTPVADIAVLTGLDLGPLPAADRYRPAPAPEGAPPRHRWTELSELDQIVF